MNIYRNIAWRILRLAAGSRDSSLRPIQRHCCDVVAASKVSNNVKHINDHGKQHRAHMNVTYRIVQVSRGMLALVGGLGCFCVDGGLSSRALHLPLGLLLVEGRRSGGDRLLGFGWILGSHVLFFVFFGR